MLTSLAQYSTHAVHQAIQTALRPEQLLQAATVKHFISHDTTDGRMLHAQSISQQQLLESL